MYYTCRNERKPTAWRPGLTHREIASPARLEFNTGSDRIRLAMSRCQSDRQGLDYQRGTRFWESRDRSDTLIGTLADP
eukprot:s692_g8.t1